MYLCSEAMQIRFHGEDTIDLPPDAPFQEITDAR
jgi:hypothetical protein